MGNLATLCIRSTGALKLSTHFCVSNVRKNLLVYTAMKSLEASIKQLIYHYTLHVNSVVTLSNSPNIIIWDFF